MRNMVPEWAERKDMARARRWFRAKGLWRAPSPALVWFKDQKFACASGVR